MSRQGSRSPAKKTPPVSVDEPQSFQPVQSSSSDAESTLVTRLTRGLEDCDWNELQEKYVDAMDEHTRVEDDLRAETTKLLEVGLEYFPAWCY